MGPPRRTNADKEEVNKVEDGDGVRVEVKLVHPVEPGVVCNDISNARQQSCRGTLRGQKRMIGSFGRTAESQKKHWRLRLGGKSEPSELA